MYDIIHVDKRLVDYELSERFNTEQISFVTRIKDNAKFSFKEEHSLDNCTDDAVLKNEQLELDIRQFAVCIFIIIIIVIQRKVEKRKWAFANLC